MNEFPPETEPPPDWRRLCARFIFSHNPFFMLSAMCMLVGLFALNDSLDWSPLPAHNLLWLILILNVYELALIAVGILLVRRGLFRDAATLFVLEAFFLVDAGFLNAEIFNLDFGIGLAVNIVLFALAFIKVGAMFRAMGVRLGDGRYPLVLAQILILSAMPGVFKEVADNHDAQLSAMAVYGCWWVVGLIPILYLLLLKNMQPTWHRRVIGAIVLLPAISILTHLCTSNWVHHVRWQSANLAPLVLGLAAAIGASDHHVRSLAMRLRLHLGLPILAVLLTTSNPSALFAHFGDVSLSPTRLVLLAGALVYLQGLLVHRHPYFGAAGALCLTAAGLGDTPVAMTHNVTTISRTTSSTLWRLVPRTVNQWGLMSIVASYVLLAIGLLLSLVRPVPQEIEDETQ